MTILLSILVSFSIYTDILSVRNYKDYSSRISWNISKGLYFNSSIESSYDRLLSREKNSMMYQLGYQKLMSGGREFQFTTSFNLKLERRTNSYLGKRDLFLKVYYEVPFSHFIRINPTAGVDFLEYFGTSRESMDNSGWNAGLITHFIPFNLDISIGNESRNIYKDLRGAVTYNRSFKYRNADIFLKYNGTKSIQKYKIQQEERLNSTNHRIDILIRRNLFFNTQVEADYRGSIEFNDYGSSSIKTRNERESALSLRTFTRFRSFNVLFNFETGNGALDYRLINNDENEKFNRLSFAFQKTGRLFGGLSFDASIERYDYPEQRISPARDSRKLHAEMFSGLNLGSYYTNVLKLSMSRYDLSYIKSYYSASSKYTFKIYLTDQSYYTRGKLQFFSVFELFAQFSVFPYDAYKGIYTRYFLNDFGLKKGESNMWQLRIKFQDQGGFIRDIEKNEYYYAKRVSILELFFLSNTYLGELRRVRMFSKNTLNVRFRKPVNSRNELEIKELGLGIELKSSLFSFELTRYVRFNGKDYFTLQASYSQSL